MDANYLPTLHPLFRAATQGSVELIEPFLGEDKLDGVTPTEDTIIHIAARLGHLEFVNHVKSRVPSQLFKQANSKGDTPFHVAARAGHSKMIFVLITCVSKAHQGDVELGFTETHLEVLRMGNKKGDTPMHEAVRSNQFEVVKLLIQQDPELLRLDNSCTGESPLHAAVELLSLDNYTGRPRPLHAAAKLQHLDSSIGESSLYVAVERGELAVVEAILRAGHEYSHNGPNGRTALHSAIIRNRLDVAEMLLESRRELAKVADANNRSPLHFAATIGNLEMIKSLLKYETLTAYVPDKAGSTPIHIAALYGKIDIIDEILRSCPDLKDKPDDKGRNLLHFAIEGKELRLIKHILHEKDFKGALNEKDNEGSTPLHRATISYQPHVVCLLVNHKGIDRMAVNNDGLSALTIALCQSDKQTKNTGKFLVLLTLLHAASPKWCNFFKSRIEIMRHVMRRKLSLKLYKEKAGPLMVVSALVAGVTFAAGFTVPGGYNGGTETNFTIPEYIDTEANFTFPAYNETIPSGSAILGYNDWFRSFVSNDIMALYCSTVAVVALIGVQLIDSILPAVLMFYFARLLTMLALFYQIEAFTFGLEVTLTGDLMILFSRSNVALKDMLKGLVVVTSLQPLLPFLYCSRLYVRFRCWLSQTWVGRDKPRNSYKQHQEEVTALLCYKDTKSG